MAFTFYAVCDSIGVVGLGTTGQKAVFSTKEDAEAVFAIAKAKGFKGRIQAVHLEIADGDSDD